MSAIRNILKSDTPTGNSGRTPGLGGQGSHFRKDDDTSYSSTMTGNEPQTAGGPSDTSAAPSQAYDTSAMSTSAATQAGSAGFSPAEPSEEGSGTATIGQTTTYSSRPLASGDPVGSIVDHESSDPMTYRLPESRSHTNPAARDANDSGVTSSAPLAAASAAWASHNQVKSMPGEFPTAGYENPYKAASLDPRVDGGKARQPGEATNLSSQGHAKSELEGSSGTAGVGTGVAAADAPQALSGSSGPRHSTTEPAPSTLTTATDPATRSAEYDQATSTRGLDSARSPTTTSTANTQPHDTGSTSTEPYNADTTSTQSHATGTPVTQPHTSDENSGMMSKMLGAVGLGGAGAAAASALGYGARTEAQDEPRDTSAIATQPGQTSQETGPPKHYRRESIPTTAYPAGLNSPRAVAPPVGGAQGSATYHHDEPQTQHPGSAGLRETPSDPHTGSTAQPQTRSTIHDLTTTDTPEDNSHAERNAGLAGTAIAAGVGAGAYGLHEHNKDSVTSSTTQPSTATGPTRLPDRSRDTPIDAVAAAPGRYDDQDARGQPSSTTSAPVYERERPRDDHTARSAALGAGAGQPSSTSAAPAIERERPREDHTARNAALGTGAGVGAGAAAYGLHEHNREPTTSSMTGQTAATGATTFPDRTKDTPHGTAGAAPGQIHGQQSRVTHGTTSPDTGADPRKEQDHTTRNAALGATAGAVAGGAAYAAHDHSREEEAARRAAADREQQRVAHEREKDLVKQQEAQEKAAAKERKEHEKELEKQHHKEEKQHAKEEKEHQKELEKQHAKEVKEHQKELEKQRHKEEKERAAAATAAEKRENARLASEEEDRVRREREAQAGIAAGSIGTAGAVAGTGMIGHEKDRSGEPTNMGQRGSYDNIYQRDRETAAHEQPYSPHGSKHSQEKHAHEEKEKKPSFFRRIFKRRKNKDTGEDEDYSTDEEDHGNGHSHHNTAAAAGVGAGAGAGTATTSSAVPTHHSDTKGRNVLGSAPDTTGRTSTDNRDPTTGLAYDPAKDPEAAHRLSREPGTGTSTGHNTYTIGRGTDSAPSGTGPASGIPGQTTGHPDEMPQHSATGLPYDSSKDPAAAARLEGASGAHGQGGTDHGIPSSATEPFGVIGEHHR